MTPWPAGAAARRTLWHPDVWLMTGAIVLALLPFGRAFVGRSYLAPVVLAVVGVALASLLTAGRSTRFAVAVLAASSFVIVALVVYPHTTTYGIPGLDTVADVAVAPGAWWRDFLTAGVPSEPNAELLLAPVLLGVVGCALTSQLLLRTRWLLAPALPPIVVFGVATAFSPGSSMLSLVASCGFALALLAALAVRATTLHGRALPDPASGAMRPTAWGITVGSLAVAVVIGAGLGVAQSFVDDGDRFAARDLVEPPIDIDDELSPLTLFRWKTDATHRDHVMFEVTLDRVPDADVPLRIPLAYLTAYDGSAWTVDTTEFRPAGTSIPVLAGMSGTGQGDAITQRYTITEQLSSSFLPSLPGVVAIDSDGLSIAYSERSGTLLRSSPASPGASYEVTSRPVVAPMHPCPAEASTPGTFSSELDPLVDIPLDVMALDPYATLFRWADPDADDPLTHLVELECRLRSPSGDYTNNPAARQGHSIARLAEVASMTNVGSDEQYASILALVARMDGLPSRVAVGFELEPGSVVAGEPLSVTASQVTAWPEVFVGGDVGWQRFDPSGTEEDVADQTAAEVAALPTGQAEPPPLEDPDEEQAAPETAQPKFREPAGRTSWTLPLAFAALVAAVLTATVLGKSWLRRRRRQVDDPRRAVAGAWAETRTRLNQIGVPARRCLTPNEVAELDHRAITERVHDRLLDLGAAVDIALYSPTPPDPTAPVDAWVLEEDIWAEVRRSVPLHRRTLGVLDPRSLIAELAGARPGGNR